MKERKIGQFVQVDKHVGVIVGLPDNGEIPDEHLAVWFGETIDKNGAPVPYARTVPEEYCISSNEIEFYH